MNELPRPERCFGFVLRKKHRPSLPGNDLTSGRHLTKKASDQKAFFPQRERGGQMGGSQSFYMDDTNLKFAFSARCLRWAR